MRVKLQEAKWLYKVPGESLHSAIEAADIEAVKAAAIELLGGCESFFDPDGQDYVIIELEDLIDDFEEVEENEEDVDELLDELYDFCDGYNIFIEDESEDDVFPEDEVEDEFDDDMEDDIDDMEDDLDLDDLDELPEDDDDETIDLDF